MPDSVTAVRSVVEADEAARDAALLAERMRAIGAWGAYAAMQDLARDREARAERVRRMAAQSLRARGPTGAGAAA